jgi:hypothetical protein
MIVRALPLLALIMLSALFTGCSHTGANTFKYLREVGHVRQLYNTDAERRIPDIRQLKYAGLIEAAHRVEEYKQTLAGLSTDGIDPEAVRFTEDFEAFLDAVHGMYLDTAKLMEDGQKARGRHFGPRPAMPLLKGGVAVYEGNIAGVLGAVGELMEDAQKSVNARNQFLEPSIQKLRGSRDNVVAVRQSYHQQARQAHDDFAKRYPENDWTLPEILPQ